MTPCPTCPRLRGPVPPSGPTPCEVLLLGEAPHKSEDRSRIPFTGPTGKELDQYYLPHAGLYRRDVRVTNAQLCSLRLHRNPSPGEALACAQHHLEAEVLECDPEWIVPMGAVACSLFRTPRGPINLELDHGIPTPAVLVLGAPNTPPAWSGIILPLYHPSAGIHDSNTRYLLQQDFPMLKRVMRDGLCGHWAKGVEKDERDYARIGGPIELAQVLLSIEQFGDGWLAIDTETDCQGFDLDPLHDPPWCLSFSGRPNTGYVIMAQDTRLVDHFTKWIARHRPRVILHNSLFDIPVLERMGVTLPGPDGLWPLVHDTMLDAYHTAWMPQGLKTLAWRELGIRMTDYLDMVTPHAVKPQLQYLTRVAQDRTIPQPYLKPRQWKLYRKAQSLIESVVDAVARGELVCPQDKIKDNWLKNQPEDVETMEEWFGPFPYRSIRHVPVDEAIGYACEDAAATYTLRGRIKRELTDIRRRAA